jgi:hypothetical protein
MKSIKKDLELIQQIKQENITKYKKTKPSVINLKKVWRDKNLPKSKPLY